MSQYYSEIGNDRSDCAVRATAVAFCMPYNVVADLFFKHGRRKGCGTQRRISFNVMREIAPGIEMLSPGERLTIGQFKLRYPKGHYIVFVSQHALAICDGVVYDWPRFVSKDRRLVKQFWRTV